MPLQLWLVIVAALIAGVYLVDRTTKKRVGEYFSGRESLDDNGFYDRFFRSSGVPPETVSKIREIFQKHLPIDLSRLQADDDLSREFKFIWDLDSLADVEIVDDIEKAFTIQISDDEACSLTSFRKIVSAVDGKVRAGTKG